VRTISRISTLSLDHHALHLVEAHFVTPAIVELGRARGGVVRGRLCAPAVGARRELDRLQRPRRGGGPDGCGIPKKMRVWDKVGPRGKFARLVSAFPHKAQKVHALAHLGRALKARMVVENAGDRAPFPDSI
jgi:hypothetical protein